MEADNDMINVNVS